MVQDENKKPNKEELEVLARNYLEALYLQDWEWVYYGQASSSWDAGAAMKLNDIREALGQERFDRAVAPVRKEWQERIAKLRKCVKCGHKLNMYEEEEGRDICFGCDGPLGTEAEKP